jgi:16S rRNA (guanine(966)-N(2))-methyltransferase RsmD
VRVIAGQRRGQRLSAPRGSATRPTAERARQALFDILGDLGGHRVLDLYAGSGALGIEALSRGAAHAVFVESSRAALSVLRQNLGRLELDDRATVVPLRVERAGRTLVRHGPFNLVTCDPPWPTWRRALEHLRRFDWTGLLAERATLVLEHPAQMSFDWGSNLGFETSDRRKWGDTGVTLYVWAPGKSAGSGLP